MQSMMTLAIVTNVALSAAAASTTFAASKPNIVYFLVDDLGYANVGFHDDEPLTTNIDSLHASGIELTSFYTYKFCSPTRSSLNSGRLPIHVNQENHPPEYPGGGVPLGMTMIAEKFASAGYLTHQIGKWHCGMSGYDRLPVSRGFNTSFGYLSGAEDHYAQTRDGQVDFWRNTQPAWGENGTDYNTFMYTREILNIIDNHDVAVPLYIYMAYQNVHGPLQVPSNYTDLYPSVDYVPRKMCLGMITAVDESIGHAVALLKARNMYNNTLIVFTSDNGGPADHANNFPYRGSKGSDFEGGVRVAAYVSGGIIPDSLRGTHKNGLMHVCDWYATFGYLAGYTPDDPKAAAAQLPAPDTLNTWEWIVSDTNTNTQSPRTELCLSGGTDSATGAPRSSGLIMTINGSLFKLVRGTQGSSMFPGPHMPNASGGSSAVDCADGWLFNLTADAIEHIDLSKTFEYAEVYDVIKKRQLFYDESYYQSDGRDGADPAATKAAEGKYRGFWGPWLPDGPIPSPPPPPPVPTPPPNPPVTGVFIKKGGMCLRVATLSGDSAVTIGACDGGSKWNISKSDMVISVVGVDSKYKYLRHHPPGETCATGTTLIIGEQTPNVYTVLNTKTVQMEAHDCASTCIGVLAGNVVGLAPCTDNATLGWEILDA
eukprot:m.12819 g.12819  ORF g.12819 m.12819 type:complete len:654 (+) comp9463_c0_seq1:180-2141(+)